MIKHLKSKLEYIDRYDRLTVEDCRQRESVYTKIQENDSLGKEARILLSNIGIYFDLLYATLQWYENKKKTIDEWMRVDQWKDQLLENAVTPEKIRCLQCGIITELKDKLIHDWGEEAKVRVLFTFRCPKGCLPHRAFFSDGEEYKKRITSPTAAAELNITEPDMKPDLDYAKDRERFCLTDKEAEIRSREQFHHERTIRLSKEREERDKRQELYDVAAQFKRLTIADLEKLLAPRLEAVGFIKFRFDNPNTGKIFSVPLIVHDGKSERTDVKGIKDIERIIKNALADSNWRLMSNGVTYRLGILTAMLRAYETEEDLLHLAECRLKKQAPQ